MRRLAALAVVLGALAAAAPASAGVYDTVKASDGPGPSQYDQVYLRTFGPSSAKTVLVLVPGFYGGVADFDLVGQELVDRVPGLQVWGLDRRGNALEDVSAMRSGNPGTAFDYYLQGGTFEGRTFAPVAAADAPFAGQWGLEVALEDLRAVIKRAARGGRKVILGGHSLGASTTVAYAAWDFDGRPGYRDIDGMVLIDGGLLGSFDEERTVAGARRVLEGIETQPFVDLLGLGIPWAAGVFAEVGAQYALTDPNGRSPVQDFPLLPAAFKPPFPATNAGLFGFAFDETTSPPGLELLRVRAGGLAPEGDPRPWQDGEVSTVATLARTFAAEPGNGTEWYFPRRLSLDVDAISPLRENAVTRLLGLRPRHADAIDVPLYAFETDLTNGGVLRGARTLVRRSKIPKPTLVNRGSTTSHLDPLTAVPERNDFVKTVVPFLKRAAG